MFANNKPISPSGKTSFSSSVFAFYTVVLSRKKEVLAEMASKVQTQEQSTYGAVSSAEQQDLTTGSERPLSKSGFQQSPVLA